MKRKILFLTNIMIFLLAVICFDNTTCEAAKTVKVNTIKVTNIDYSNYYTMRVGGTLKIKTAISPKSATNKNITWSSSDQTVAKVSKQGIVTGVNRGFCKITGVVKDGSKKTVSFYVRVYSEKEFIYCQSWNYENGDYSCTLSLSATGEYTMYNASAGEELESGLYTLNLANKTITLIKTQYNGNTKKVWKYTIVTRSKMILSNGTSQATCTRNYSRKNITCTSKGFLYVPNGPEEALIIGYRGIDTTITVPSMINKRKVTSFGGINENTDIEHVILPDSLNEIGTFENCTSLKEIKIPDGIRDLDSFAFKNCTSLETVQLSANLNRICQGTFQGCSNLRSIELPEKVEVVDREAFWNCTSLEKIYFPKKIEYIESEILKGCNQAVIYGYKDTCAEEYAKEYKLTFIER